MGSSLEQDDEAPLNDSHYQESFHRAVPSRSRSNDGPHLSSLHERHPPARTRSNVSLHRESFHSASFHHGSNEPRCPPSHHVAQSQRGSTYRGSLSTQSRHESTTFGRSAVLHSTSMASGTKIHKRMKTRSRMNINGTMLFLVGIPLWLLLQYHLRLDVAFDGSKDLYGDDRQLLRQDAEEQRRHGEDDQSQSHHGSTNSVGERNLLTEHQGVDRINQEEASSGAIVSNEEIANFTPSLEDEKNDVEDGHGSTEIASNNLHKHQVKSSSTGPTFAPTLSPTSQPTGQPSLLLDDKTDLVLDVISVGSVTRRGLMEAQRQTWASHSSVRHFFTVTEDDEVEFDDHDGDRIYDPEPYHCYQELEVDDVLNISKWCRTKYGYGLNRGQDDDSVAPNNSTWVMQKWSGHFGRRRWLVKKENPVGWMCAQRRFARGLAKVLQRYRELPERMPDFLLLVDDDTYVNLDLMLSQEFQGHDPAKPYVGAGCRIRYEYHAEGPLTTFAFGGFGQFFARGSLERLIQPIHCSSSAGDENLFNTFNAKVCSRLHEDLIDEQQYFRNGMSVSDLMDARARAEAYRKFQDWEAGFCFHGDHYLASILHLYGISDEEAVEVVQRSETVVVSKNESITTGSCLNERENCDPKTSLVCHYQSPRQLFELHDHSRGDVDWTSNSSTTRTRFRSDTFDVHFEDTALQHKSTLLQQLNRRRRCYEGIFIQLDDEWGVYVGGFRPNYSSACRFVQFWNIYNRTWARDRELQLPKGFPQTHHAVSYDDRTRFLYLVSGQLGGGCNVASPKAIRIHTDSGETQWLPDLPFARYAAGSGLVRVKRDDNAEAHLHVFGGASIFRNLTAREHWRLVIPDNSTGVKSRKETSTTSANSFAWEELEPVPDSNAHAVTFQHEGYLYHGSALHNDFGVQPTESIDVCRRDNQMGVDSHHTALTGSIWRYPTATKNGFSPHEGSWERVQDMPLPAGQALVIEMPSDRFLVVGGSNVQQEDGGTATVSPHTWVRAFHPNRQQWDVLSPLASPTKFGAMAWYDTRANSVFVVRHDNNKPNRPLFNEGRPFAASAGSLQQAGTLHAKYLVDKRYRKTATKGFQKCIALRVGNETNFELVTFLDNHDAYDQARSTWNLRKNKLQLPDVVTYPSTVEEVGSVIQCAKRNGYKVCARNGKHSYEGDSSCAFGIVVDVSKFNEIKLLDKEKGSVRLGAGLRLGQVALEVEEGLGLIFPMGHCASVGLTGLILVGGQGVLSRHFGMTADFISAIELVDQNGTFVRATAINEYADYLWLAKGGGSGTLHFPGIVTTIETLGLPHPEPAPDSPAVPSNVTKGKSRPKLYTVFTIEYEANVANAARLSMAWQEFYQDANNTNDALFSRLTLEPWFRLKPKPKKARSVNSYDAESYEKYLYLSCFFYGNDDRHVEFMERFYPNIIALIPGGKISAVTRLSSVRFRKKIAGVRINKQLLSGEAGWDINKRWKGYSAVASKKISEDAFRVLAEGIYESEPYTERYVELKPLGGAISNASKASAAFWHRDAKWWALSNHYFLPSDSETRDVVSLMTDGNTVNDRGSISRASAILRNSRHQHSQFIDAMSTSFGGLYSGYIDHGNSTGRDLQLYYGDHANRIAEIKLQRDPHNVFHLYLPNAMDESWKYHQQYELTTTEEVGGSYR